MEKKLVKRQKKNGNNIFFIYTVLFLVISAVVFSPFLLRGNGFVALTDSYHEVFPTFVYIRDYITDVLCGNVTLFDFRIGLGDDALYTMGYMGILDVLSVFCAFMFPEKYVEFAFYFSIILKLYMSGIGFILYAKKYVKKDSYNICGALLYAFQIFTLFNAMDFPPYLMVRVTLPFVLKGVDEICENRRLSLHMILGLCAQGLMGFYCLYIEVLIVIIYFLFVLIFRIWGEIKETTRIIGIMLLNGILGIGLSCIVFIPSIVSMSYGIRKLEVGERFQFVYDWDTVSTMLGNLCIPNVYSSPTTISIMCVCCIVICLFSKSVAKETKYITPVLWILSFSPIMGSVMNGFSYSSMRWYFAVGFFASVSVIAALQGEEKLGNKEKNLYYLIIFSSYLIHFIKSEKDIGAVIRIGVFVILALILPYVWNYRKREKYILCYTCIVIVGMGLFTFGPKVLGGSGYSANFHSLGIYDEIKESVADLDRTESFERWDIYDSSFNASLVGNYYGTSEYFSTINKYVAEFYQELSISPGIRDALNILRGLDGRQEILSLLAVSKYMEFETDENNKKNSYIMNNDYFIPLGYIYDSYLTRREFDELTAIEKSSQILDSIILEENSDRIKKAQIGKNQNESIEFKIEKKDYTDNVRIYFQYEKYKELIENSEGEIYVQIEEFHGDADVYIGNKEIRIRKPSFLYYTGIEEYWFNLSEVKQDAKGYYYDICFEGETDFEEAKLSMYWHPINYDAIVARQKNILNNIQIGNNSVSGDIVSDDETILFLSIPYSSGWRAYIDGEKTEILRANIGFMAIPLMEGEHNIQLEYTTPGLNIGIVVSICSFIVLIVLYFSKNKRIIK